MCGAAAAAAFYGCMRCWDSKLSKIFSVIASVVLAVGFVLFMIAEIPVWTHSGSDDQTDAPYLIVFGAAVHGSAPSLSMRERVDAAFEWIKDHPDGTVVLSGGRGENEDLSEAQAMNTILLSYGVSQDRILLEENSTSSYENLLFSLQIIKEDGGDPSGRVALCSSEYHMYRLCILGSSLGCEPVRMAAGTGHFSLRVNYAVREAFAVWYLWVFGIGQTAMS